MPSLQQRLASVLGEVVPVEQEADGALTQVLAWDLPLTKKLRDRVAEQALNTMLGSVALIEKVSEKGAKRDSGRTADVMLRYNFPGAGLTDDALRTLVLMVLDKGANVRRALIG